MSDGSIRKPKTMGKVVVEAVFKVLLIYYGWLLPLLVSITVSLVDDDIESAIMSIVLGLLPLLNWMWYYYGFHPSGLLFKYTVLWAVAGIGLIPVMCVIRWKRYKKEQEKYRREEQEKYHRKMIAIRDESISLIESLAEHLSSAEEYLAQAEVDFADSAFAPFWDSIEKAAGSLAYFNEGVRRLKDNSSRYTNLIREYEGAPPGFPFTSAKKLDVGVAIAERMNAIVRKAQRNPHFAMIYEQRRTNQILVAGFTTLADALEQMTLHITGSINHLARSVDVTISTMRETHGELMKELREAAERERKALEMLDNIQRRRRSFP